jgi:hypothetical protein
MNKIVDTDTDPDPFLCGLVMSALLVCCVIVGMVCGC